MFSETLDTPTIIETVADAVERARGRCAKAVASHFGLTTPTARNILERRNAPSATTLIRLMRSSDEVFEAVIRLAERSPDVVTAEQKARIEAALAILQGRDAA
jgi:plasmid maintenance system antidote protein VapI